MARLCVNINEMCDFLDRDKLVHDLQRFGADGINGDWRLATGDWRQKLIIESPFLEDLLSYISDNHVDTIIITDVFNSCFFEDVIKNMVSKLKESGIKVSALIEADPEMPKVIADLGFDSVTLDCGIYLVEGEKVIENYKKAAEFAKNLNLTINASHGINMKNMKYLIDNVPDIDFVIVGHEFVSDALYFGLENTVQMYRRCLTY